MNKRHSPFRPKRLPYNLVCPRTTVYEKLETSARGVGDKIDSC